MQATDTLSSEHRVIERVLAALEKAANAAEAGAAVRSGLFLDAADFIRGFADGCHHRKEENVLFATMSEHGVPVEGGPIGVMLNEHELGRMFTREMRAGAENWAAGESGGKAIAIAAARKYVMLLRQHIAKEDQILFPMADRAIPPEKHAEVWQAFEKVEHEETGEGVHEKYLGIADALEKEADALA
ncbi:MAG: hemerythrin domain-containing protein [Anaerolineales bacterium]|nr:hemerythrin domain-containing protein [Anaerolineales bacterium]